MFQVKIIELNCFNGLENRINEFLNSNNDGIEDIIDIKYGTHSGENGIVYYASIAYKQK